MSGFFGRIWRSSRQIGIDFGGVRLYGGAAGFYANLFLIFFVIGAVLLLFGVNLDAVDRWLDARAGWFGLIGTLLFKALLVVILLVCLVLIGNGLFERVARPRRRPQRKARSPDKAGSPEAAASEKPMGFGAMIVALIVAYFAYVGIVN